MLLVTPPFLGCCARLWLAALLVATSLPALAQPTVTGFVPASNAVAAPRASNVALTFSQAIAAAADNVRVFSQQHGGQLNRSGGGQLTGGGTTTLTFDPAQDFRPGETVFVTVPAAVQSTGGVAVTPRVYGFTTAVGGTGRGNFTPPTTNPEPGVGFGPYSVAVGDLDGDGDLDLLTANAGANTVSVRLNDGQGNFTAPATNPDLAVAQSPESVAVGDLDGDGDLDLLTANYVDNTVSVRLNDGTGSFTAPANNPEPVVGGGSARVVVGDVDGDGDLDLLTANRDAQTVSVRLNDGTGSFSGGSDPSVGLMPVNVVVGDVDGDGDLDLLAANYVDNTVSVRLNDGTGNFTAPALNPNPAVGDFPLHVAVGDVDGDGDLDLLTANSGVSTVSVRLNDGTGNFTPPATNPEPAVDQGPESVTMGDVDGDGDLDLLTNNFRAYTVSVRLNDGTGNFTAPATNPEPAVGRHPYSVVVADVDGDGDLDLLAANRDDNTVSVRLNGPTTTLASPAAGASAAFSLLPNPASASAVVGVTDSGAHQLLTLFDPTGRRVASLWTDAIGAAVLPVSQLRPGLYLLRAADGRTRRLVVE